MAAFLTSIISGKNSILFPYGYLLPFIRVIQGFSWNFGSCLLSRFNGACLSSNKPSLYKLLLGYKFTFSLLTSIISSQLAFLESEINLFWSKFFRFLLNKFDLDSCEFAKKIQILQIEEGNQRLLMQNYLI